MSQQPESDMERLAMDVYAEADEIYFREASESDLSDEGDE